MATLLIGIALGNGILWCFIFTSNCLLGVFRPGIILLVSA